MKSRSIIRIAAPVAAALMLAPAPAVAGTATTQMAVTALSISSCIVAATPMAFGTLSQLDGNPNDSTASVTVGCTPGTAYNVGLDDGLYASGGDRRMKELLANAYVPYRLYSDASRSTPWGDSIGTNTVAGTAGLLPAILPVYGRVPGNIPAAPIGAYLDSVTVTVTF